MVAAQSYDGAPNFDAQVTRYAFPGDAVDLAVSGRDAVRNPLLIACVAT